MHHTILSDLTVKKVNSISTMYTEAKGGAGRMNRPLWALIIKYEGETHYISNGKKYISNINNLILLPKGSNYEWSCTKAGHFATIEFECDKTSRDIFSFPVKNGALLLKTVQRMEINRTMKRAAYRLDEMRDLYDLLSALLKAHEQTYIPSEKKQKLLPAIEYIAENYNKHICNDELAAMTGLSTAYFRKLFKEVMGEYPINYIKAIKMKKAQKMLKSDYSSITDIAHSLGYNNVYEFSRDFKKHMGLSPSAYARQNRV